MFMDYLDEIGGLAGFRESGKDGHEVWVVVLVGIELSHSSKC